MYVLFSGQICQNRNNPRDFFKSFRPNMIFKSKIKTICWLNQVAHRFIHVPSLKVFHWKSIDNLSLLRPAVVAADQQLSTRRWNPNPRFGNLQTLMMILLWWYNLKPTVQIDAWPESINVTHSHLIMSKSGVDDVNGSFISSTLSLTVHSCESFTNLVAYNMLWRSSVTRLC